MGETPMIRGHGVDTAYPWLMNITNVKLLYLKGALFLMCGMLASTGILLLIPSLRVAVLLAIAVWSFARAYYFAFYVIEHYVDPSFKFAGLGDFLKYALSRNSQNELSTKFEERNEDF
jgi:hypothetical protein